MRGGVRGGGCVVVVMVVGGGGAWWGREDREGGVGGGCCGLLGPEAFRHGRCGDEGDVAVVSPHLHPLKRHSSTGWPWAHIDGSSLVLHMSHVAAPFPLFLLWLFRRWCTRLQAWLTPSWSPRVAACSRLGGGSLDNWATHPTKTSSTLRRCVCMSPAKPLLPSLQ